jgi:transposase
MPHIQGVDRHTVIQFPPTLDDDITSDNPVRVLDACVDQLDLHLLGFTRAVAARTGRPAYHPGDLLKRSSDGSLNRMRSSRRLEREPQRTVAVMWLVKKLTPDCNTSADVRKDKLEPLRAVCRACTLLCNELELFGGDVVAIDGSTCKAVNNRTRTCTPKQLERALAEVDTKIATYVAELEQHDAEYGTASEAGGNLQTKIARLQERRQQYVQ